MSWNIFSLVLACATAWVLLFIGYLPIAIVRRLGAEPVKAAIAWALVAATAPAAVFHWYLIFAVICLVAWTKLERPGGKICLATAAALGLSLGLVFPLETSLALLGLKTPVALGPLYLGGAVAALAYVTCLLAPDPSAPILRGYARWLVIIAMVWMALLLVALRHAVVYPPIMPVPRFNVWLPIVPAGAVVVLAMFAWQAVQRGAVGASRALSASCAGAAFAASLLTELVLRAGGQAEF